MHYIEVEINTGMHRLINDAFTLQVRNQDAANPKPNHGIHIPLRNSLEET